MINYEEALKSISESMDAMEYVAVDKITDPDTMQRILNYQGFGDTEDFASKTDNTFKDLRGFWMESDRESPTEDVAVDQMNVQAAYVKNNVVHKIKTILYADRTGKAFIKADVLS